MSTPAAFQATYSDWRVIKGRKCVQVVFELPLEAADSAYQVLGGMPIAAKEIWCAVARIKPIRRDPHAGGGEPTIRPAPAAPSRPLSPPAPAGTEKIKRKWSELPYVQQACIRCSDPVFWAFLRETHRSHCNDEADAADYVRTYCDVTSRKHLLPNSENGHLWTFLDAAFDDWQAFDRVSA